MKDSWTLPAVHSRKSLPSSGCGFSQRAGPIMVRCGQRETWVTRAQQNQRSIAIKKMFVLFVVFLLKAPCGIGTQEGRTTFSLNGMWEFEQTEKAFPPMHFTRRIPVPGLIHLSEPLIEQHDTLLTRDYKPRWRGQRGLSPGAPGLHSSLWEAVCPDRNSVAR